VPARRVRTVALRVMGCRSDFGATTRLSTTDLFGTRYHVFGHTFTKDELLQKVRTFATVHVRADLTCRCRAAARRRGG
jgi:hypothetical protein